MHQILLYYKYVHLIDPETVCLWQKNLCEKLGLTGRIIVAAEGINGTVEGELKNTKAYTKEMNHYPAFAGINWKRSEGNGKAFPKLSVKVRDEIVTTGEKNKDFGPLASKTGKYLTAKELYNWYREEKEFYVLDMRNDYEYEVGRFKNSIWPDGLGHFRDVKNSIKTIEHLKDKTIVTVCTGGVRCETASGLLQKYGFENVYQLEHGIVTFMDKYPNTYWEGKLYVFDSRELYGKGESIGKCRICGKTTENMVNYFKDGKNTYGLVCEQCCENKMVELEGKYKSRFEYKTI